MRYAHIVGWGKYLPEKVLTNDDLSRIVDTSDKWIRERTGIRQRRIAGQKDTCATMATAAALDALDVANISAAQVGMIIVATTTPDFIFPATACLVQDALGARNAGAFDLSAACSGFVYGLSLAADAIKAGSIDYALIIGSETMTRIVDWKDRNTCVLFGDGAGAVVLEGSDQPGGVLSSALHADGSGGDTLYLRHEYQDPNGLIIPHDGGSEPATADSPSSTESDDKLACTGHLYMNGREVYRFGTRVLASGVREVMHKAGWEADEVDMLVPHQANIRIIDNASKALAIPLEKFYCNIERFGNTSAASIPLAICEAAETGRLHPDDKVIMVGFGAGLTWASAAVVWGTPHAMNLANRTMNRVRLGLANVRSRARRVVRRFEDRIFGTVTPNGSSEPATPAISPGRNGTMMPAKEAETAESKSST